MIIIHEVMINALYPMLYQAVRYHLYRHRQRPEGFFAPSYFVVIWVCGSRCLGSLLAI